VLALLAAAALSIPTSVVDQALDGRKGTVVIVDTATGAAFRRGDTSEKLPPCSTFKIWNTVFGLETGIIKNADDLFWKWDGKKRFLADWSKDQTLRSAFALSCVPAYQELARKIGQKRMDLWIAKIGYGDQNTSSGLDVFWLPEKGRKPLLISPDEQAALIARLIKGEIDLSPHTLAVLKDVMLARKTDLGTLYGKTGTGTDDSGKFNLGWFVGYLESQGQTYAFAVVLKGDVMGKDASAAIEQIFSAQSWL
jgi:beta-lactamase class D